MFHSDSKDAGVSQGAREEEPETQMFSTTDVKRRTASSGLQCPHCRYRCGSMFSFHIHVGSQHPLHCENMCVGRLGKVVFYQRTAKLFHCHICFFTSRDYAVLFEHLLARHCRTASKGGEASSSDWPKRKRHDGDPGESESAPCYDREFCEQHCTSEDSLLRHIGSEHDVHKSHACEECGETFMLKSLLTRHVHLRHTPDLYRCPYCPFGSSLRGLHQHLGQCRAEGDQDNGDGGTEEKEARG